MRFRIIYWNGTYFEQTTPLGADEGDRLVVVEDDAECGGKLVPVARRNRVRRQRVPAADSDVARVTTEIVVDTGGDVRLERRTKDASRMMRLQQQQQLVVVINNLSAFQSTNVNNVEAICIRYVDGGSMLKAPLEERDGFFNINSSSNLVNIET